ncbi:unnamed protein product, partial [Gulo gulo]
SREPPQRPFGPHLADCGAGTGGCPPPPRCPCPGRCCPAAAPRGCPGPASLGPQRVETNPGARGLGWAVTGRQERQRAG